MKNSIAELLQPCEAGAPRNSRTDHCVMMDNGATLKCLNCGQAYPVNLPMPLALYADLLKGFSKLHRLCVPPAIKPRAAP